MTDSPVTKQQSWRWLSWSIVLVFAAAVILIAVISAGIFDPKPVGEPSASMALEPVKLEAGEGRLTWLPEQAPSGDHTLRLSASLASGEPDSAYGLVVGDEDHSIVVAVSPVGYVSIWQQRGEAKEAIIPWRTWPHVAQGNGLNELWLDIEDEQLTTVRANRELLWQGGEPVPGQRVGLWAETFGRRAKVDFQHLEVFAEPPGG